jgi:glycerol-3-phosphate acyltransferase PlsY
LEEHLSMGDLIPSLPLILAATIVGYLLGALPLAVQISRRLGVDIFSAGTGLAGASNVLHSVGPVATVFVVLGDLGKGAAAVVLADKMGVDGTWVLVPGAAAIFGHWNSIFTRFRGGDGLVALGGVILAVFPVLGAASIAIAGAVALAGQRLPFSSLFSVVFGYGSLVALVLAFNGDTAMAVGVGGVAGLVLARALLGHRRRRAADGWDDDDGMEEANGATEHNGSH